VALLTKEIMRYDSPDFLRCAQIAQIPRGDPSTISKLLFSVSKYAMVEACVSSGALFVQSFVAK
jgi:hypothetical protein